MARPSKPHLCRGNWRTRIDGVTYNLGPDKRRAAIAFHKLMARRMGTVASGQPETIAGAVDHWLTLNDRPVYRHWVRPFLEYAGRVFLDDVGRDFLARYHLYLKGQWVKRNTYSRETKTWSVKITDRPLSAETIRHYLATAKGILSWALKQGWLATMPDMPRVAKAMRETRDIEPKRLSEILDHLPERAGRILKFIATTGCRPAEACHLEWRHVHLDVAVVIITEHKTAETTGQPRTIYLTPEATEILQAMLPDIGEPTGYVFTSRTGKPYKPSGLRSILKRHGDGVVPYSLRHTFAQTTSDAGQVPLEVLSLLLGHRDTKTTEVYFKVRDQRARQAASKLRLRAAKAE